MKFAWCCAALLAAGPALADVPEVPGGDLFGFTDATDTGDPGDKGLSFEWTGLFGKREGFYRAQALKTEFGVTPAENLFTAFSFFAARHNISGVPDFDNINRIAFDGLSTEIMYRFLTRSAGQPVAAAFSIEPRWARVDGAAGTRVESYSAEAKLFVDRVIVPDRFYGAFNANFAPSRQREKLPDAPWVNSSGTNLSTSFAWQLSPQVFIGGEVRLLAAFEGAWLNHLVGHAVYAGPHMLINITDKAALNLAWTPQVAGRGSAVPDADLDLENFERHQFRAKLSLAF